MSERTGQPVQRAANRLARESSPYLLQHSRNPVDWWAWGPGAFAEARRRDVPIFLSIGYSTCYWCHVMERESFEDASIGALLSERFVCIKVDREERPDVDDVYMAAVQMMTGHGGWPMHVALEPESLRPFWSGTYFPPEPRHGMPSFRQIIEALSAAWATDRDRVLAQADEVARAVGERMGAGRAPALIGAGEVATAITTLLTIFDRTNGGFGGAPKFPQPAYCDLLMAARKASDDATGAAMDGAVRHTLDRMAIGGLFDQVGGGFHRYSVDAVWLVPHFEKMLYDNGQLLETYANAAATYSDAFYARVVRRIAGFVLDEMKSGDGAFFTAQDAEVDGREGLNYLWSKESFRTVLGVDAAWAADVYGVAAGPNFRDPHHPADEPASVLRLEARPERIADRLGMKEAAFLARLDGVNRRLLAARNARPRPRRDDKVLASWNGLMIAGLACAGRALGDPELVRHASRAATAVLNRLLLPDGTLLRCRRGQEPPIRGTLEDYAMLTHGLLALGAAEPTEARWMQQAAMLMRSAERLLGDGAGGFFDVEEGASDLFVRPRSTYDGAMPCGASVMLNDLITLYHATNDSQWLEKARACLASLSAAIAESPVATVNAVRGLLRLLRIDSDGLSAHLRGLGAAPAQADPNGEVTLWASANEVYVTEEHPAEITLRLEVPPGLHINGAEPGGSEALVPLRVEVVGGEGFEAFADYPPGEAVEGGSHRILRGTVEFPVAIEARGPVTGRPQLVVRYQVCSDRACHEPVVIRLDVELRQGQGPYAPGLA